MIFLSIFLLAVKIFGRRIFFYSGAGFSFFSLSTAATCFFLMEVQVFPVSNPGRFIFFSFSPLLLLPGVLADGQPGRAWAGQAFGRRRKTFAFAFSPGRFGRPGLDAVNELSSIVLARLLPLGMAGAAMADVAGREKHLKWGGRNKSEWPKTWLEKY